MNRSIEGSGEGFEDGAGEALRDKSPERAPGRASGVSPGSLPASAVASPEAVFSAARARLPRRRGPTVSRAGLTERQREVLDFITESINSRGYPPTLREIGEQMQIRSTNGVNDHLKALERKGFLQRQDLKSRALRVTAPDSAAGGSGKASELPERHMRDDDYVDVPLLGKVAAGQPILAVENREDTVRVDRFFVGQHRDVFALRVQGDSMIEAGIFDGDFLFVRKQPNAHPGDIVVAMINEEATVKYFYPESDRIVFKPANSRLNPIEVRQSDFKPVDLLGTVVGVYRKFS